MAWFGGAAAPAKARDESASLRAEIRELQEKLTAREQAWVQFNEDWKKAQDAQIKTSAQPPTLANEDKKTQAPPDPNPFPARFNRTLHAQSQNEWTLEECGEAKDGSIREATLFRHGATGAVSGMLRCGSMNLVLPPSPDAAWLLCRDGQSIVEGRKTPLPDEGFRIELAPVKIDELRAALPELFVSGKTVPLPISAATTSGKAPASGVEPLRERLDALWAKDPGGYRLVKLGSISDRELRDLEIEERSGDSVEARYTASIAKPRFDEAGKTVELILERGSIDRKGKLTPFPPAGFRLHFSGVSPASWKAAGGPSPR